MNAVKHLVWLRNDLRLDDHPAINLAQQQGDIRVAYVATPQQFTQHHESPARLGLKAHALQHIGEQLAELGIELDILECATFAEVPELLASFCIKFGIEHIWFMGETPLDERQRDQQVTARLAQEGITAHDCGLDLIVPQPVLNQQGLPFKVFTPYYKRWQKMLSSNSQAPLPPPKPQGNAITPKVLTHWGGDFRQDLWPPSEQQIHQQLQRFCEVKLTEYGDNRDIPSTPGTSTLSPYLANGQIGPRRLVASVQMYCGMQHREWLSDDWLRELAWRDFYKKLMLHFPTLSMNKPFKADTDRIIWRTDDAGFQAWREGKTGFPIVDAAMRQLKQTGWMHNRLRMIAASFLTKLLFIDWRRGETFFMEHLIDGEFCANNGGWQWSASTGCDAAPYFRVFNPTRQSEKFDSNGDFIRRFVPELNDASAKDIHNPSAEQREQWGYPQPVVDYKPARQAAIDAFANL